MREKIYFLREHEEEEKVLPLLKIFWENEKNEND